MTTTLLLGAGASIGAGAPSTREITDAVLRESSLVPHTNGTYGPALGAVQPREQARADAAYAFLRLLNGYVEAYYDGVAREVNYEDLYYAARQVADSESGEYDNPVVGLFADRIRPAAAAIASLNLGSRVFPLGELAEEACNLIHDLVWEELRTVTGEVGYAALVKDAVRSLDSQLCLATLNHDLLTESMLDAAELTYVDGFAPNEDGARIWNQEHLQDRHAKVCLLKLHGSVNWFRVRSNNGGWESEEIAIGGKTFGWRDCRPQLLLGTFNKLQSYPSGQFAWLHSRFRVALSESETLVVSGYSFGDKGINSYLCEWAYAGRAQRLVVIHPDGEDVLSSSRGAIRNKVREWREIGLLKTLDISIEEATWEAVSALAA